MLVAEDQRTGDDEVTDPTVPVVVGVGAADTDRSHFDEDLIAGYRRCRHLLDAERFDAGEHAGAHLGNGGGCGGSLGHDSRSLSRSFPHCGEEA